MATSYPEPIIPSRTKVGWIGIGIMGSAMATHILSAGYSLTIYARDPTKSLYLQALGARLASSPREVAQSSDVVFTMLGNPKDVRQVVLGENGIVSGMKPGSVAVDSTSSHPSLAREISAAARTVGCWSVDAPVSGGDTGAQQGKLAIFAAGDREIVDWLQPLFNLMGTATYMGEAGCGQSCKIANQIMVSANLVGLSEGMVFADKTGLDVGKYLDAVRTGAAGSSAMELWGDRMIRRDFRAGGYVEYMVKDLGMALDLEEGREGGDDRAVVLPGAALAKQLCSGMVANGDSKLGIQGLVTVVERLNGN